MVNSNNGVLVLVELNNADLQVVIANGGSRGDYVTPDYTNGTLLLTQTDLVDRLSCGANCSISSPPPPGVPEPASPRRARCGSGGGRGGAAAPPLGLGGRGGAALSVPGYSSSAIQYRRVITCGGSEWGSTLSSSPPQLSIIRAEPTLLSAQVSSTRDNPCARTLAFASTNACRPKPCRRRLGRMP